MLFQVKKEIIYLLFILCGFTAKGQHYYFNHIQADNGLANNTVLSLIQDKRGFIWIGTKGGVNRFDGTVLKSFASKTNALGSVGSNVIYSLCEDKNGLIWLGTDLGLYAYDPVMEVFTLMPKTQHLEINSVNCDKNNDIWFISRDAIYKYDSAKKKIIDLHLTGTCLSFDPEGNLWFGDRKGTLNKFTWETKTLSKTRIIDSKYSGSASTISKILANGDHIFIGTEKLGFKCFNTKSGQLKNIVSKNENGTEIYVRDIIKGDHNKYWFATESGLYNYDIQTEKTIHLKKQAGDPYALSDNAVYCLIRDKNGDIWAGTYFGGLNYSSKETSRFEKFYPLNTQNSISGDAIREITSVNDREIWIGTEDAGINKLDTLNGKFTQFTSDGRTESISYPNIHGLLADKNKLFIGAFTNGLEIMDIKSGKVVKRFPIIIADNTNSSDFVKCIFKTSDSKVLIGTTRAGLFEYDPVKEGLRRFDAIPRNSYVYAIAEDHTGTIWTGSLAKGTFFFNPKTGQRGNIRFYGRPEVTGGTDFEVQGIMEDHNHCLWFATDGGGLIRLDSNRKTFKKFTTKEGLPTNNIYKILEDNDGNLWVSSLKGLICINLKTEKIKVYTKANGLITDQFNYSSAYKSANGKMYFGSVKGLIAFEPSLFNKKKIAPPLYITGLQINSQDISPNQKNSPLNKSILSIDTLKLNHQQTNFNIEFAALGYSSPEGIRYRYKMEGLDKSWTYLTNNRKAYFTDLSPGDYKFTVIAESNTGTWITKAKSIYIHISPPIWRSDLAYLSYFIFVCLFIYLSIRHYQKDLNRKNQRKIQLFELQKEKEVYAAKIEFFTTIAHEIQTPLTLIKGPIGWAIEKSGDSPILKQLLMVEKNTDRLLALTTHLLDFRKAEINQFGLNFIKTDIHLLIVEQIDFFKAEAEKRMMTINYMHSGKITEAAVDREAFIKITSNLLSNAIKYGEKSIDIKLGTCRSADKSFSIQFINDGETIPVEDQLSIFKPFIRARNVNDKQGTGIGLTLAKSLAELHNGTLKLVSSTNGITIFEVRLPVHQEFEFIFGK